MITGVGHITILVNDQSKALEFYSKQLGFDIVEDNMFEEHGVRWITVAPQNNHSILFTLMLPTNDEEKKLVGKQAGSIPLLVFTTDDCRKTAEQLKSNGVKFIKEPTDEFWGIDALFTDLDGNIFDLCQIKK